VDTDRGIAVLHAVGLAGAGPASLTHLDPEIDLETERAIEELTGAILLVSGGRFPTVVITNLARCREAMAATRAKADEAGVVLEPIARVDGDGCDVAVRAR
jgi:hypothetical protein